MKKKSFLPKAALAAITIWGGLSCSTNLEDHIPQNLLSPSLDVFDGTLSLSTFDNFEDLISKHENLDKLNFESFAENRLLPVAGNVSSRINEEGLKELTNWEGSYLLDILDKDGFVFINKYLFHLDFNRRLVVVSSDFALKNDIIRGDFSNEKIRLFSFEDDVIGLLEINSESSILKTNVQARISSFAPAATISSGCSWDKCDNNGDSNQNKFDPITSTEYRLEAKHVYQAAGIYFRLMSEAKHMKRGGNLTYTSEPTDSYLRYDYLYDSKKSSIGVRSGTGESSKFISDHDIFYYESSRGLNSFRLDTQFEVFIGGSHGSGTLGWWFFNLQRINKS